MSVIICGGCMRSGKSDDAMSIVEAYHNFGLKHILFQPEGNTRDVIDGMPVWRTGNYHFKRTYADASYYPGSKEVVKNLDKFDVFGFEEPHWINKEELLGIAHKINDRNKIMIVSGLNYFHNGAPVPQMEALRGIKGSTYRQGVQALCETELKNGEYNIATRTQMLINGEFPRFDSPTDLPEASSERFLSKETARQSTASYYPVCINHWTVLPPKDDRLFSNYKKYYLDIKEGIQ
ncbi:hypothetical protein HN747_03945 [archaeon]|nr:hypothetical protein [archaeon]